MLQFHKTKNDEWVVVGPEAEVKLGLNTVAKKDGTTEDVEVMRLGRAFEKDGVQTVYGYIYQKNGSPSTTKKARTPRANAYFAQLSKDEKANKAGVVRYCDLCGEEAEGIGRDSKGKLGDLCGGCEEIEEEERVFA